MVDVKRSFLYLLLMMLFFPLLSLADGPVYLDPTFNSPLGFSSYATPLMLGERPNGLAIQGDGKIVVADTQTNGEGQLRIALLRYNGDGTLDGDFGNNGRVLYEPPLPDVVSIYFAADVAIQADGKIVVTGFRSFDESTYDLIVLRYLPSGNVDSDFGGGEVSYNIGIGFDGVDTAASIAIQNDGKILVACHSGGGDARNLLLLRFTPFGELDTTFNNTGEVTYGHYSKGDVDTEDVMGKKVVVSPDGKILVLIKADAYTAVLRYNPSGEIVGESMPFLGKTMPWGGSSGAIPKGMTLQGDGKVVVAGQAGILPFVLRYRGDGEIDATFGTEGVTYLDYREHFGYLDDPLRENFAKNVTVQPDGKILLVASCPMDHTHDGWSDDMDVLLVRYLPEGSMDSVFGVNGSVSFDGGWRDGMTYFGDSGQSAAVQSDGKIVVVGNMRVYDTEDPSGSHVDLLVMRFTDQAIPDLPQISVSPGSYDYGEVPAGNGKIQQFTITNVSQSDVAVTSIDVLGPDRALFSVDPGTCENLTPVLGAGQGCSITVRFAPQTGGQKTALLVLTWVNPSVRSLPQGPLEVSLSGTCVAAQEMYVLRVSTDGTGTGFVVSKPGGIKCGTSWSDCEFLFEKGQEVALYRVIEDEESRFTGWSGACSGKKECRVAMDSHMDVKATFMADPTIRVFPRERNFKNVLVGRTRTAYFVVGNSTKNGKKPLVIDAVDLTDTSAFRFIKNECTGTLQPREKCVFGILFQPENALSYASQVVIRSNDPANPEIKVDLVGNGVYLPPPRPKPPRRK